MHHPASFLIIFAVLSIAGMAQDAKPNRGLSYPPTIMGAAVEMPARPARHICARPGEASRSHGFTSINDCRVENI